MDYEFTTDGCSGGLSLGWKKLFGKETPWEGCCVEHDKAYWAGGSAEQRQAADQKLRECVTAKGHPVWGFVMYWAVRFGGLPCFPTSYRWGYGFKYPKNLWYTK